MLVIVEDLSSSHDTHNVPHTSLVLGDLMP